MVDVLKAVLTPEGEKVSKMTGADKAEFLANIAAYEAGTIDRLKFYKNEEIKAAIEAANLGTFTHGGKVFSCDQVSRSYIDATDSQVTRRDAMPPGWLGYWKADDNTLFTIDTVEGWHAFYDAMYQQGLANFAHSQELKAALAVAMTEDQIKAITW